jgi:hypothetical protein
MKALTKQYDLILITIHLSHVAYRCPSLYPTKFNSFMQTNLSWLYTVTSSKWNRYINLVSKRPHFQRCSCPSTVMLVLYTICVSHSDHRLQGILCLPWHNILGQCDITVPLRFNSQIMTVLLTTVKQSNKTSSNQITTFIHHLCVQSLYNSYFKEMTCNKKKDKFHLVLLYSEYKLMSYTLNPTFWHFELQANSNLACT